jgi:hypothetical protein
MRCHRCQCQVSINARSCPRCRQAFPPPYVDDRGQVETFTCTTCRKVTPMGRHAVVHLQYPGEPYHRSAYVCWDCRDSLPRR